MRLARSTGLVGVGALLLVLSGCGSNSPSTSCSSKRVVSGHCIEPGAFLIGTDLSGTDLSGADLTGANLGDSDLSNAKLTNANLTNANLDSSNLAFADLTGALLSRSHLSNVDLTHANLTNANLAGADVRGANLTRATLTNVDVTDADLSGVNLSGADLTDSDLSHAIRRNPTTTTSTIERSAYDVALDDLIVAIRSKIPSATASDAMRLAHQACQAIDESGSVAKMLVRLPGDPLYSAENAMRAGFVARVAIPVFCPQYLPEIDLLQGY